MSKQTINNGETLGVVRGKINDNADELYTSVDSLSATSFTAAEVTTLRNFLNNWDVTSSGHLIPKANAASDLGNAEYKVRHLFLSDN